MKKSALYAGLILYLIISVVTVFRYPLFSVLDEQEHFYMIDYLSIDHRLPGFNDPITVERLSEITPGASELIGNYEAVQTPLYYYLMSLITYPFKDPVKKFYLCRLISAALGFLNLLLVNKALSFAKDRKLIPNGDMLPFMVAILAVCPVYLDTFCRVSNDALMIPIATLIYYEIFKYLNDLDEGNLNESRHGFSGHVVILFALGLLLFWVKLSAIPVIGSILLVLFFKKKIIPLITYIIAYTASCIPWFALNYHRYGELTGSKHHLAILDTWMNLSEKSFTVKDGLRGIVDVAIEAFRGAAVYRIPYSRFVDVMSNVAGILLLAGLAMSVILLITGLIKKHSVRNLSNREILLAVFALTLIAETILLVYESIGSHFNIIVARAYLCYTIPIIAMTLHSLSVVENDRVKCIITGVFIIFGVYLTIAVSYTGYVMCLGGLN